MSHLHKGLRVGNSFEANFNDVEKFQIMKSIYVTAVYRKYFIMEHRVYSIYGSFPRIQEIIL